MKQKRTSPLYAANPEVLKKLIEIGQDPNLTYREIMNKIPVTFHQVRWAIRKGQIPNRSYHGFPSAKAAGEAYERWQKCRSVGGQNSAITRWGHYYGDDW